MIPSTAHRRPQVRRILDNAVLDIAPLTTLGGHADAAAQDAFCCKDACSPAACVSPSSKSSCAATCVVQRIYDQTPHGNHLHVSAAPAAKTKESPRCLAAMAQACGVEKQADSNLCVPCLVAHMAALATAGCKLDDLDDELWCGPDKPVNATRGPVTVGGDLVYGAVFEGGMGYRVDNTSGVATGNEPESIMMVRSKALPFPAVCFTAVLRLLRPCLSLRFVLQVV